MGFPEPPFLSRIKINIFEFPCPNVDTRVVNLCVSSERGMLSAAPMCHYADFDGKGSYQLAKLDCRKKRMCHRNAGSELYRCLPELLTAVKPLVANEILDHMPLGGIKFGGCFFNTHLLQRFLVIGAMLQLIVIMQLITSK